MLLGPHAVRASPPSLPPSLPPRNVSFFKLQNQPGRSGLLGEAFRRVTLGRRRRSGRREGRRSLAAGHPRRPTGQPAPRRPGLAARTTGSQAGSPQEGASEAAAAPAAATGASAAAAAAVAAAAASVAATAAAAAARRRGPAGGAAAGLRPSPRGWEWREAGGETAEARLPLRAYEGRPRARSEAGAPCSQPFRKGASGSSGAEEEDTGAELRRHFGAPPPPPPLLRPALSSSLSVSVGKIQRQPRSPLDRAQPTEPQPSARAKSEHGEKRMSHARRRGGRKPKEREIQSRSNK